MKLIILLSLFAYSAHAQWIACNTAGKAVTVRYDTGDVVTLPLPGPKSRPTYVAFLTEPCGNLLGKAITATLHIDAPAGTIYGTSVANPPATVRLFFQVPAGAFNFNDSDSKHTTNYWWCWASATTCDTLDNGMDVTITATVTQAGSWSASHGEQSADTPYFNTAAANAHQVGLALAGSNFYDTGINANNSTTVLHVTSFTAQ